MNIIMYHVSWPLLSWHLSICSTHSALRLQWDDTLRRPRTPTSLFSVVWWIARGWSSGNSGEQWRNSLEVEMARCSGSSKTSVNGYRKLRAGLQGVWSCLVPPSIPITMVTVYKCPPFPMGTVVARALTCQSTFVFCQESTMGCWSGLSLTAFPSRSWIRATRCSLNLSTSQRPSAQIPPGRTSRDHGLELWEVFVGVVWMRACWASATQSSSPTRRWGKGTISETMLFSLKPP